MSGLLVFAAVAFASEWEVNSIVDTTAPTGSVALSAGGSETFTINVRVTGTQAGTATFKVYRDWTLSGGVFTGSNAYTFSVPPQTAPATWTDSVAGSVNVAAGHAAGGPHTLTVGAFDITNSNATGAKLAAAGLSATYSVTVNNPAPPSNSAPVITSAAFNPSPVACQVSSTLSVSFTDADAGDTHTASVVWGDDGSTAENLGSVTSPFTASHTYAAAGAYTATVTVSDGTASDSEDAAITVNQTYTVAFLSPLDASSGVAVVKNTFKNGRVVPVKVTIKDDCAEAYIDGSSSIIPTVKLRTQALSGGGTATDAVTEFADAGASSGNLANMRWSDGKWIYNLDSKALGLKTLSAYRLDIYLGESNPVTTDDNYVLLQPTK